MQAKLESSQKDMRLWGGRGGGLEDVKERLGLEEEASFVAVLKAEAFGIPAAVGAAAEAPPIAIAQSESRPESMKNQAKPYVDLDGLVSTERQTDAQTDRRMGRPLTPMTPA